MTIAHRIDNTSKSLATEPVFSYGTLQMPQIQKRVLGRIVIGEPDTLYGYDVHYNAPYPMIFPSDTDDDFIQGEVIYVTPAELDRIDFYEGATYVRIRAELKSGIRAWVYCGSPALQFQLRYRW